MPFRHATFSADKLKMLPLAHGSAEVWAAVEAGDFDSAAASRPPKR